ncbi:MAG: integrase arm-type DNA-binding domain-containing protein [Geminicoccaceae bacterium]
MPRTLTAEAVTKIKAGPSRREIADSVVPGLYLVIQPSGARSFAVRTRINGKPAKLTLGPVSVLELAKARELARSKLEAVLSGTDPREAERLAQEAAEKAAEASKKAETTTVKAVVTDWLKRDQAGNRDVATVRRIMDREVLPAIGEMQIDEVRKRDIIALIDKVADKAPIRANRVLAHTKRMFRWAAARDLIEHSPAASIEKPSQERPRDRVLSDDELIAIWRAAERIGGAYGHGVQLLMLTGARIAEVFEARRSEIVDDGIRLPRDRSKNDEARIIWLSPQAKAVMEALPHFANSDWLVTATGKRPFRAIGTSKIRLDAEIANGENTPIPDWRHHDLRRTLATNLQRLGERLEVIEHVLGHVSGSRAGIVGTYQKHRFEAEAKAALIRWGAHVDGLVNGDPGNVVRLQRTVVV